MLLLFESTSSFLIIDDGDDDFVDDDDDDEDKKKREEEEEEMGVLAAARVLDVVGDEVRRLEPPAGGFNIFVSRNARAERTQREKVCVVCAQNTLSVLSRARVDCVSVYICVPGDMAI